MPVGNDFYRISICFLVFILINPSLCIQIHSGQQEPAGYPVNTSVLIASRSFQFVFDSQQFTFCKLKNLLTRILNRNFFHTRIFIHIRNRTKQIAKHRIAISTYEAGFCAIAHIIIFHLFPKSSALQLAFRTFTQKLVTIGNTHIKSLVSPCNDRSIGSIPLQIQTFTQTVGRGRHQKIIRTQLLQIKQQAHITGIALISTFKVAVTSITTFLPCQNQ